MNVKILWENQDIKQINPHALNSLNVAKQFA